MDALELPDVQVPFPLQLLQLQLQVRVLFLQGHLPQLQDLLLLVVLVPRQPQEGEAAIPGEGQMVRYGFVRSTPL